MLKFSGDMVYLVLIKGSNLDRALGDTMIDLIRAGLQRHRVIWIREMSEKEIREIGNEGPTVDRIEIGEFESQAELRSWLTTKRLASCPAIDGFDCSSGLYQEF